MVYWARSLTSASARPTRATLALLPTMPGWLFRFLLIAYLVVDRLTSTRRVSTEEITSLAALDYYAIFQIVATFILGVCLLMQLQSLVRVSMRWLLQPPFIWIGAYYLLAIASALWSEVPLLTLFKAGQCVVFLLAALLALAGLPSYEYRVRFLIAASLAYIAASYVGYFAWTVPELGFSVGTLHNVVGTVPFIGVLFLVLTRDFRASAAKYWVLVFPILLAETVFTMYVGVAVGMLAHAYMRSPETGRALLPFAIAFIGALIVLTFPHEPGDMVLGIKSVDDIASGTGRFDVWRYALTTAFPENPVLGYGFVMGDAIGRRSGVNAALGQLHNAHLSALINLGLIGALLWFLFLGSVLLDALRVREPLRRSAIVGALATYAVHQFSGGATLSSMLHPVWISQALFFFLVAMEARGLSARVMLTERTS